MIDESAMMMMCCTEYRIKTQWTGENIIHHRVHIFTYYSRQTTTAAVKKKKKLK